MIKRDVMQKRHWDLKAKDGEKALSVYAHYTLISCYYNTTTVQ